MHLLVQSEYQIYHGIQDIWVDLGTELRIAQSGTNQNTTELLCPQF